MQPVQLSRADGVVKFNDIMLLRSSHTGGVLSGDTGDYCGNDNEELYMVTASPDNNAYSRSAWRIVRYREEKREFSDPRVLHYGEQFHIVTHPDFHVKPLYLYSTMKTIMVSSKLKSEQLVALSSRPSWNTVWFVLGANPKDRRLGRPIGVGEPVLFVHAATSNYLSACDLRYQNVFGKEMEVYCGKKLNEHKVETEEQIWTIVEGGEDGVANTGPAQDLMTPPASAVSASRADAALRRLRDTLAKRSGYGALKDLGRQFALVDRSRNGMLDLQEASRGFEVFLKGYGVIFTKEEMAAVFSLLDLDKDGQVSYDEFVRRMRGDMTPQRLALVDLAFRQLDTDGSGVVTMDEITSKYNVAQHPKVLSGEWPPQRALAEFLKPWDRNSDGTVTKDEFIEYYNWVSPSIDRDDYFELMMRNCWRISGGKGVSENTANTRCLVTFENGKQQVIEIINDLGLKRGDMAEMRRRLEKQGVKNIKEISLS